MKPILVRALLKKNEGNECYHRMHEGGIKEERENCENGRLPKGSILGNFQTS